jgi:hypothetical protein
MSQKVVYSNVEMKNVLSVLSGSNLNGFLTFSKNGVISVKKVSRKRRK